jgi:acetyl esterase/lipase
MIKKGFIMRKRWIWIALIGLLVTLVIVSAWALTPAEPMLEALAAMDSDQAVMVEQGDWLVFKPAGKLSQSGLILYPGGLVDPRAYAPLARAVSAQGYVVIIARMPLNLAVLDAGAAGDAMASYPEIVYWAVGGHSLGGAMAARFAYQNPERVDGLVLWAAYPASDDDLSERDIAVTSIYATNDGLTSLEDIEASRALLPQDSNFFAIEGGNHAQFGWYGEQRGDNLATISREVQQDQIVSATINLLESMEGE